MSSFCHCIGQDGRPCVGCPTQRPLPSAQPCSGCQGRGITIILGQTYACVRCNGTGLSGGPFAPTITC